MGNVRNNSGFTIIELSLSMAMLSVLMLILLLSSMQMVSIYNRGITLKRVNQSARLIGTEMQNALREAQPSELDVRGDVATGITGICAGNVSYVWSYYDATGLKSAVQYDDAAHSRVSFAKVTKGDPCSSPTGYVSKTDSKELVADGLVVRDPTSVDIAQSPDGKDALVSVTYTLSTETTTDFILDASGRSTCNGNGNNDFCALNTFTITAYVRGGV